MVVWLGRVSGGWVASFGQGIAEGTTRTFYTLSVIALYVPSFYRGLKSLNICGSTYKLLSKEAAWQRECVQYYSCFCVVSLSLICIFYKIRKRKTISSF